MIVSGMYFLYGGAFRPFSSSLTLGLTYSSFQLRSKSLSLASSSTSMSFSPRIVDFVTQKRPDSLAGLPSWASSS